MSAPLNRPHTAEFVCRSVPAQPDAVAPQASAAFCPKRFANSSSASCSSSEFAVPERARKFLTYLIDETLAGRADRIKAYSIAIEVFGRNESFDAQNDPAVRIEAGRIRGRCERYYLVAGQADPIVVGIPKGGYVPRFELRGAQANALASDLPAPVADQIAGAKRRLDWRWAASLVAVLLLCASAAGAYRLLVLACRRAGLAGGLCAQGRGDAVCRPRLGSPTRGHTRRD